MLKDQVRQIRHPACSYTETPIFAFALARRMMAARDVEG